MPMKPHAGETQSEFTSRCVPEMIEGGRERDQAVAACLSIWREAKKEKTISPDGYDSREDFMVDCVAESGDEDACALAWEERSSKQVVRKTHVSHEAGMTFVLSDMTPDRMGDVIDADGWDLRNFKKNPVALFNHNANFPIGKWINLRNEKGELRGDLKLAPLGTSDRIDEIRRLVDADILRAVSVGFLPIQSEPLTKNGGGTRFRKTELVESSLVSIPANPNALAIAKSLNISRDTVDMVFAGQGKKEDQSGARRGSNGGSADTPRSRRGIVMTPLTKRIEATEQRLVGLRDQLTTHLEGVDDENVTEADVTVTNELNKKIADQEAMRLSLLEAETKLKGTVDGGGNGGNGNGRSMPAIVRPFSVVPRKIEPLEFLVRAGTIRALSKSSDFAGKSLDQIREQIYGTDEATRVICDLTLKAATAPAKTDVAGWAAELVQQINAELMPRLTPSSVYPALSGLGLRLDFGRNGRISIPTRSATPTVAGSFVGEGAPIPVRQAGFTAQLLTPKKMAVITTWTREMDEHSVPAIEGLLRNAIQEDTAVSIDTILLDTAAATTIRPAGLRNGVGGLTATTGGGFAALVGDLKQLTGAVLTATNGNVRNMAFIMNPQQALSIGFIQPPNPGGLFPFAAEINAGRLMGYPVIKSGTVPLGVVIVIDAADFVSVTGDNPRFEISDQATLHMEDTTPLNIGTAGTPATVAAPTMSMFQTDSMALRLILPMNWVVRRSGVIAWTSAVTW